MINGMDLFLAAWLSFCFLIPADGTAQLKFLEDERMAVPVGLHAHLVPAETQLQYLEDPLMKFEQRMRAARAAVRKKKEKGLVAMFSTLADVSRVVDVVHAPLPDANECYGKGGDGEDEGFEGGKMMRLALGLRQGIRKQVRDSSILSLNGPEDAVRKKQEASFAQAVLRPNADSDRLRQLEDTGRVARLIQCHEQCMEIDDSRDLYMLAGFKTSSRQKH